MESTYLGIPRAVLLLAAVVEVTSQAGVAQATNESPRFKVTRMAPASVLGDDGPRALGPGPFAAVTGELELRVGQAVLMDPGTVYLTTTQGTVPLLAVHVVHADKPIEQEVEPPVVLLGVDVVVGGKIIKCLGRGHSPLLVPKANGGLALIPQGHGKVTLLFLFSAPVEDVRSVTVLGITPDDRRR